MIIYGKDHYDRARTLARALNEKNNPMQVTANFDIRFIPKLNHPVLTAWGHGGPDEFCEMSNLEFCVLLYEWKKANPQLQTVEIITCDARHVERDFLTAFAESVAKYAKEKAVAVEVKALPRGPYKTGQSIFFASANTGTYCYLSGPDDQTVTGAQHRLFQLLPQCNENFQEAADMLSKESGNRVFSLNSGYFSGLRSSLVKVTAP